MQPLPMSLTAFDAADLPSREGRIALIVEEFGKLGPAGSRLDKAMRGALARAVGSDAFKALKPGESFDLAYPAGLMAEAVQLVYLPRKAARLQARRAGGGGGQAAWGETRPDSGGTSSTGR